MILIAMLAIAVMTIQGSIAATTSLNTITTSVKYRALDQASLVTDAGLAEAKARLVGLPSSNAKLIADPLATLNLTSPVPDPLWSAYVLSSTAWTFTKDPDYNLGYTNYIPLTALTDTAIAANSVQSNLPYWSKIRHKREYDAERAGHTPSTPHYTDGDGSTGANTAALPGSIIYYGYSSPTATVPKQFTIPPLSTTAAPPVELVTSYGTGSTQIGSVSKAVQIETAREVGPPLLAAMYSQGNVNFQQVGGTVSGVDNCTRDTSRAPVYTKSPGTTSSGPEFLGSPATPQQGTAHIDIAKYIDAWKAGATVLTGDINGATYGSSSNYVTVYSDTSNPANVDGLKLKSVTGYGLLLIKGDLTIDNHVTWRGPILVTGVLTIKAPGSDEEPNVTVRGGILAGTVNGLKKGFNITYDSCHNAKALASKPFKLLRWRTSS